MAGIEDVARAQADAVFMTSKAEIVEYYRDNFPKNWTRHAAEALSGTTDHKSREYKAAIRQFQGSRIDQAGGKLAPKYESLGKQLPPDHFEPKGDTVRISVSASQKADKHGGSRDREFVAEFTGTDAYDFVNNPDLRKILQQNYPTKPDLIDMFMGEGADSDYGLYDVSAS